MSDDQTYNGWVGFGTRGSAYATWAAHLWASNEELAYQEAREAAEQGAKELRQWFEGYIWAGLGFEDDADLPACLATDLLKSSVDDINMAEIRSALLEGEE